ncbi:unnamed protein product [Arabidopsis lyrata]|nr:unnamed protein product [Arabidopsis lyrata]
MLMSSPTDKKLRKNISHTCIESNPIKGNDYALTLKGNRHL